jgi:hypothetical protein
MSTNAGNPTGIAVGSLDDIRLGTPTGNVLTKLSKLNWVAAICSVSTIVENTSPVSRVLVAEEATASI